MSLDIDGTIIRITQESLKKENTVCKDTCMSTLIYQVTYSFEIMDLSHLFIRHILWILLNKEITGLQT